MKGTRTKWIPGTDFVKTFNLITEFMKETYGEEFDKNIRSKLIDMFQDLLFFADGLENKIPAKVTFDTNTQKDNPAVAALKSWILKKIGSKVTPVSLSVDTAVMQASTENGLLRKYLEDLEKRKTRLNEITAKQSEEQRLEEENARLRVQIAKQENAMLTAAIEATKAKKVEDENARLRAEMAKKDNEELMTKIAKDTEDRTAKLRIELAEKEHKELMAKMEAAEMLKHTKVEKTKRRREEDNEGKQGFTKKLHSITKPLRDIVVGIIPHAIVKAFTPEETSKKAAD